MTEYEFLEAKRKLILKACAISERFQFVWDQMRGYESKVMRFTLSVPKGVKTCDLYREELLVEYHRLVDPYEDLTTKLRDEYSFEVQLALHEVTALLSEAGLPSEDREELEVMSQNLSLLREQYRYYESVIISVKILGLKLVKGVK
jgi:hypothetical protein